MQLRDFLIEVGAHYNRNEGFDTPTQNLLAQAREKLSEVAPADFVVRASGGQRPLKAAATPWIGFFDPDVSTTPHEGLYLVYLLRADQSAWTLALLMGTERMAKRVSEEHRLHGKGRGVEAKVRDLLSAEAGAIRAAMPADQVAEWDSSINLSSDLVRPRRYEAATILARTYPLHSMPTEARFQRDLISMCALLSAAIHAKRQLALMKEDLLTTFSTSTPHTDRREWVFDPGIDRSTPVREPRQTVIRTPRHEGGLRRYGEWLKDHGFRAATNVHPRDFVILGDPEWIGEYKVVYGDDVARATRDAHSQLKEYRHFLYPKQPQTPLLAVFSSPITAARVKWLNSEGIAVVWAEGTNWRGCPWACGVGLAKPWRDNDELRNHL